MKNVVLTLIVLLLSFTGYAALPPIAGVGSICVGNVTHLTNSISGGTWSSTGTTITISSATGTVTGISVGTATVTYTVGTDFMCTVVTVNAMPGFIDGSPTLCSGSSTTLNCSPSGGIWESSNITIATIGSTTGVITGVAGGYVNITYTLPAGCRTNTTMMIYPSGTGVFNGCNNLGVGDTIAINQGIEGLSISSSFLYSSNPAVCQPLNPGRIKGITAGVATISAMGAIGCIFGSITVTVTPTALVRQISGSTTVCPGSLATLTSTAIGGTWSSSNPTIATITSGGVVSGLVNGTTTITYSVLGGLYSCKRMLWVPSSPDPIIGPSSVCVNDSITLYSSYCGAGTNEICLGGYFSSNDTSIGKFVPSSGKLKGVSPGNVIVTYTGFQWPGCSISRTITVNPTSSPTSILGTLSVCAGTTTSLSCITPGGIWSSSNLGVATINTTGIVTGISAGTSAISYTISNICGTHSTFVIVTVNTSPPASTISGLPSICEGESTTLTSSIMGGIWNASNPAIATVSSTGTLSGITAGFATISYTTTNSCGTTVTTKSATVNPQPDAGVISGSVFICEGATTTLSSSVIGGIWTTSDTTIAISSSGVLTGITAGTAIISYSVTNICGTDITTATVTVNPLPNAGEITGTGVVCEGSSITLGSSVIGGTWSTTGVNASITGAGLVTGIIAGSVPISYSITNSCGIDVATAIITVNPLPHAGAITGLASVCLGSSITLTSSVGGGLWSTTTPSAATVISTGVVTGVTAGIAIISYNTTNSCGIGIATYTITVNPLPHAGTISIASSICEGASTAPTSTTPSGIWATSDTTILISSSGVLTGVNAGTAIIFYSVTNICGTDVTTATITVNPLPDAGEITGTYFVCEGSTITLGSSGMGGSWSTAGVNASITGTGLVTGIIAGSMPISYSVTNMCGIDVTTATITVNPLPDAGIITGVASVCLGASVTLASFVGGGVWLTSGSSVAIGSTTGVVTGLVAGTAAISYSVTNSCGTDIAIYILTVNPIATPFVSIATSAPGTICSGTSVTYTAMPLSEGTAPIFEWHVNGIISGTSGASYTYMPINGDHVKVRLTSNAICALPDTASDTITIIVTPTETPTAHIIPFPSDSVCEGSTIIFTLSSIWAGAIPVFKWYKNSLLVDSGSTYSCIPANGDNIYCKLISSYTCRSVDTVNSDTVTMVVSPVYIPSLSITAHPSLSIMLGQSDTLNTYITGAGPSPSYQWYVNGTPIPGSTNTTFISSSFVDNDSVTCRLTDTNECTYPTFNSVIIHVTSNVKEYTATSTIQIYPNPTNGIITLKGYLRNIENVATVVITNMLGQVVYIGNVTIKNGMVDESISFDNTLANGLYLLQMQSAYQNINLHFALQK